MNKMKRMLALCLACIFLFSMVPVHVLATEMPPIFYPPVTEPDTDNENILEEDGFTYELDHQNFTATLTSGSLTEPVVEIPAFVAKEGIQYSVTAIADSCFKSNETLTDVIVPESVLSIGACAFDGCTALVNIQVPEALCFVGPYAFRGTAWLELQENGPVLMGKVFYLYKGETPAKITIPDSVNSISSHSLPECTILSSVYIPASVTRIPEDAFSGCSDELLVIGSPSSAAENFASANLFTFVAAPSLEIQSLPEKLVYVVGDELDLSGGSLFYCDPNGNIHEGISMSEATVSNFNSSSEGDLELVLTYEGLTVSFQVEIIAKEPSSIRMESLPVKTSYLVGDTLDLTGATITLVYNNGSEVNGIAVAQEMVSVSRFEEAGPIFITVTYEEMTTQFEVIVTEVEVRGIEWISEPTTKEFLEGSPIDVSGGQLKVWYTNGTWDEVDLEVSMIANYHPNTLGTQDLTVEYAGYLLPLQVTVIAKSVSEINIAKLPNKLIYAVGEFSTMAGGTITVFYNNNTQKEISFNSSMVSGFDTETEGTKTLTVTYEGKTVTFEITVIAFVKGDLNYDKVCDRADAVYLLYHTFLPTEYPVYQDADFNGDGTVSDRDVFALLKGEFSDGEGEEGGNGSGTLIPGVGDDVTPVGPFPITRSASRTASPLTLSSSAVQLQKGKTAELTVTLDAAVTFTSVLVQFSVGENVQIVSAEWLINGDISDCNIAGKLAVLAVENASPVTGGVFRFTVTSDVISSAEEIGVTLVFHDETNQVVATVSDQLSLPVVDASFLPGDLNADDIIDTLDGLLLLRHLNGWDQTIACPEAMDVTGDGLVDTLDGLILLRYLNGWDVTLGGN